MAGRAQVVMIAAISQWWRMLELAEALRSLGMWTRMRNVYA